ncbi:hypothetical protein D3C87_1660450 [compost metagenome]
MTADIAGDLAAAGGEAGKEDVLQIQRIDQVGEIVGIVIHVVAVPGLGRAAVAAAVMGDDAKAVVGEVEGLRLPAVRRQRPAVAEHDDRAILAPPVLVIDLDAIAGDDAAAHGLCSLCVGCGA